MRAKDLKIGDTVKTWCTGQEIEGKIVSMDKHSFTVEHEPIGWGSDVFTKTRVDTSKTKTYPLSYFEGQQITK